MIDAGGLVVAGNVDLDLLVVVAEFGSGYGLCIDRIAECELNIAGLYGIDSKFVITVGSNAVGGKIKTGRGNGEVSVAVERNLLCMINSVVLPFALNGCIAESVAGICNVQRG